HLSGFRMRSASGGAASHGVVPPVLLALSPEHNLGCLSRLQDLAVEPEPAHDAALNERRARQPAASDAGPVKAVPTAALLGNRPLSTGSSLHAAPCPVAGRPSPASPTGSAL